MVKYNISVQVRETVELKQIDEEAFEEPGEIVRSRIGSSLVQTALDMLGRPALSTILVCVTRRREIWC
jgi:hypothetical protein